MENDSEYEQSVANRLHAEGTEMQHNVTEHATIHCELQTAI